MLAVQIRRTQFEYYELRDDLINICSETSKESWIVTISGIKNLLYCFITVDNENEHFATRSNHLFIDIISFRYFIQYLEVQIGVTKMEQEHEMERQNSL